ncbi:MAG: metal-dependent transcriptional regulator [Coriobacteriaceae bacterium]|nr:metal-dependent transcriptional regulator [Coriobacteriaceae bacterium]
MSVLTKSSEDYLEAIYELAGSENKPVRSVDIADKLGVSRPSVNNALNILKKEQMVVQEPYGAISLTCQGQLYGQSIYGRHMTLFNFLHLVLGVDPETAEEEACEIEHTISEDTIRRWREFTDKQLAG